MCEKKCPQAEESQRYCLPFFEGDKRAGDVEPGAGVGRWKWKVMQKAYLRFEAYMDGTVVGNTVVGKMRVKAIGGFDTNRVAE